MTKSYLTHSPVSSSSIIVIVVEHAVGLPGVGHPQDQTCTVHPQIINQSSNQVYVHPVGGMTLLGLIVQSKDRLDLSFFVQQKVRGVDQ